MQSCCKHSLPAKHGAVSRNYINVGCSNAATRCWRWAARMSLHTLAEERGRRDWRNDGSCGSQGVVLRLLPHMYEEERPIELQQLPNKTDAKTDAKKLGCMRHR